MATILILEDSQVLLTKLSNELKQTFSNESIITARSVSEAQSQLSEYDIDIFIIDIFLPDGNGIDFLCDVKMIAPDAKAIIMTAQEVPDLREQADELGVLRFFHKPLDSSALSKLVQKILNPEEEAASKNGTGNAPNPQSFQASLSSLTTIDIIQLKCLSRSTQVLEFSTGDDQKGKLHFQRGEIVHAEIGSMHGIEAFFQIVQWKGGRVEESPEPIASEHTISQGWEGLLMDAAQKMDEANA